MESLIVCGDSRPLRTPLAWEGCLDVLGLRGKGFIHRAPWKGHSTVEPSHEIAKQESELTRTLQKELRGDQGAVASTTLKK